MSVPFACDMSAIPAERRVAHERLIRRLFRQAAEEIRERADGFSFRLPHDEYSAVAEFVGDERLCCPFLHFTLEVSPNQGPLWLHLTGPAGVASFIRAELRLTGA